MNKVFVEDPPGMAPTLQFWLGEAPARSDELSAPVSRLREEDSRGWQTAGTARSVAARRKHLDAVASSSSRNNSRRQAALGTFATLDTVVFERFFDDVGEPTSSFTRPSVARQPRLGMALRKRFCRQFNSSSRTPRSKTASCCRSGRPTAPASRT